MDASHWGGDHVYKRTEASVTFLVEVARTSDCTTISNSSPSDCSKHAQSTSDTSSEYSDGSQFSDSESSDWDDDGTSEDSVGSLGHWSKVPATLAPTTIDRCRAPANKYNKRFRCQEVTNVDAFCCCLIVLKMRQTSKQTNPFLDCWCLP
jgi:hypothetical protein